MLEQILSDMIATAEGQLLKNVNRKLHNALHINIFMDSSGTTLTISRDRYYPSEIEWRTVCGALPKGWKAPAFPKGEYVNYRYQLRAELEREKEQQTKLW